MIDLKNLRHFISQSEGKHKPIISHSHMFSHASHQLHVFGSTFDWFTELSVFFVVGPSDYFIVLVLQQSIENGSNDHLHISFRVL